MIEIYEVLKAMHSYLLNCDILELRALSEAKEIYDEWKLVESLSQDVVQIENINRFIKSLDKLMNDRLRKQ